MGAIPLTKTVTLAAYVRTLRAIGAPVESGLRQARLPVHFEEIPDTWVPYLRLRSFIADMADREGVPDLGLVAGSDDPGRVFVPGLRDPLLGSLTLFQALQRLPSLTSQQTTHIRAWLEPVGDQVRFCVVLPATSEIRGFEITETRTLRLLELVIRAFVGPTFAPTRVLLASRARDLRFDLESSYRGVPVRTDQPYGAIELPRGLLCSTRTSTGVRPLRSDVHAPGATPPATFSEALMACLEPYFLDSYPHVALAAEIAGCSVRTLQRRLIRDQTTYSEVVDKVRCRAAMSQLRDGELSLGELAQRLGYSEQSAFTRAFRRWTSSSPSEYRTRKGKSPRDGAPANLTQ